MVSRIEKAAVIGSGIMGGGIAALCASAGIPTILLDIVPFDLKDEEKNDHKANRNYFHKYIRSSTKQHFSKFQQGDEGAFSRNPLLQPCQIHEAPGAYTRS